MYTCLDSDEVFFRILCGWKGQFVRKKGMFENERQQMVDRQLIARGIANESLIAAIRQVPRHLFVPKEYWSEAYEDYPVSIGHGQTISQPYVVALMLEMVHPHISKKLLEIGSGSGYLVAVASHLFKEVIGIERIEPLCVQSRKALNDANIKNVRIECADGYEGDPDQTFDAIIVSCSCSHPPKPLIDQLALGGIFVAPVGDSFIQELVIVRREEDGSLTSEYGGGVRFVPMISEHDR